MYIILTYKTKNYALYCFYGNINVVVVVTLIRGCFIIWGDDVWGRVKAEIL